MSQSCCIAEKTKTEHAAECDEHQKTFPILRTSDWPSWVSVMATSQRQVSVAGPPAGDGHPEGVVGREQRGLQGQVGHGAAPVLGVDPALDGLPLI